MARIAQNVKKLLENEKREFIAFLIRETTYVCNCTYTKIILELSNFGTYCVHFTIKEAAIVSINLYAFDKPQDSLI